MKDKLSALRRNPSPHSSTPKGTATRFPARAILARVLPWGVLTIGLLLLVLLFGERLIPAKSVSIQSVVTAQTSFSTGSNTGQPYRASTGNPFAAEVQFQASGWFEPDPLPVRATALTPGVVEFVHVLEGQQVKAGEIIATLIQADAGLNLARATAALVVAKSAIFVAEAEESVAALRVEILRRRVIAAQARQAELADLAKRAQQMGREVVSLQEITQAGLRLETQVAEVATVRAELAEGEADRERLLRRREMLEGQAQQARVEQELRQLELGWTEIRAPIDGLIQRLVAAPGRKLILTADNTESATVALLYDPEKLQARIDVPLAEAARLRLGQAVLVESEFLPETRLHGHVQRIVGEADLQRNTLQVKVSIHNPDTRIRPEMLCRARFLDRQAEPEPTGVTTATPSPIPAPRQGETGLKVFAPESAIFKDADGSHASWALDTSGKRVELRPLSLGETSPDGFIEVQTGLRPGDRIVLNPPRDLKAGDRVQPIQ